MSNTAILHIGWEKCASTSIQEWLLANLEPLRAEGIEPLTGAGFPNATKLAAYAADYTGVRNVHRWVGVSSTAQLEEFRCDLHSQLEEEVARTDADVYVFSNEHLTSQLRRSSEVKGLFDMLKEIFDDIRIVAVLRPQYELAVSRYFEELKSGSNRPFAFRKSVLFDFQRQLSWWQEVVPTQHTSILDLGHLPNSGGVVDYIGKQILGVTASLKEPDRSNVTLDPVAMVALSHFNNLRISRCSRKKAIDRLRQMTFGFEGRSLATWEQAQSFQEDYVAGNRAIAETYEIPNLLGREVNTQNYGKSVYADSDALLLAKQVAAELATELGSEC